MTVQPSNSRVIETKRAKNRTMWTVEISTNMGGSFSAMSEAGYNSGCKWILVYHFSMKFIIADINLKMKLAVWVDAK